MCETLTPVRTGLILTALLLLGLIFMRVMMGHEGDVVRTNSISANDGQVTQGTGVKGLRGSLP